MKVSTKPYCNDIVSKWIIFWDKQSQFRKYHNYKQKSTYSTESTKYAQAMEHSTINNARFYH